MAVAAAIAALGLELDHTQLGAALVRQDRGLDGDLGEVVAIDHVVAIDVEQRVKLDLGAVVHGQALHEEPLALLDAVLLAACLDDRVHGHSESDEPAADAALAPERRRPPLRPRRRGFDSSSSSEAPFSGAGTSSSEATAAVRPTSSMRTRCFSPTYRVPPVIEMMYPSILATASPGLYMCGSTISTCTSSPSRNGTARSSTSSRSPSSRTAKCASGSPSEPSKTNTLPVSSSIWCNTLAPFAVNSALTRGLICSSIASAVDSLARSRIFRSNSIAIVSSDLITPSPPH